MACAFSAVGTEHFGCPGGGPLRHPSPAKDGDATETSTNHNAGHEIVSNTVNITQDDMNSSPHHTKRVKHPTHIPTADLQQYLIMMQQGGEPSQTEAFSFRASFAQATRHSACTTCTVHPYDTHCMCMLFTPDGLESHQWTVSVHNALHTQVHPTLGFPLSTLCTAYALPTLSSYEGPVCPPLTGPAKSSSRVACLSASCRLPWLRW